LGRQPALGLAELESLYGADSIRPAGRSPLGAVSAVLELEPEDVDFDRLGGTIKLAKVLTRLDTTSWDAVEQYLHETIPKHLQYVPEGKFRLGLSVYGIKIKPQALNAAGLRLKKTIKAAGRSVRIVPNTQSELNSAQVLHNQLTGPTGWELIFVHDGNGMILAQTVAVQDIEAYAARDQARPKRDARVGMLPPKLAQIIVNLAAGPISASNPAQSPDLSAPGSPALITETAGLTPPRLLDPFCGTGVVLQEAALMGYDVYGSDLEPRMIEYTQANLDWLLVRRPDLHTSLTLEPGDATSHRWQRPVDLVAGETYLGQPLTTLPSPAQLQTIVSNCDNIHRKFLRNLTPQLPSGTRLCLAVPAWRLRHNDFQHLPALDRLEEMGYTRISFVHATTHDLVYARADQIVARELVVLQKK
jgi:tRNA G10  N-methylase Trm11